MNSQLAWTGSNRSTSPVSRACNRLQKVLEGANIKLASVATDILGRSGREMLSALVGGETEPAVLAELAHGKLRQKLPALQRAMLGQCGAHQRFLRSRRFSSISTS